MLMFNETVDVLCIVLFSYHSRWHLGLVADLLCETAAGTRGIQPAEKLSMIFCFTGKPVLLLFKTNQSQFKIKIKDIRNYNKNNSQ